MARPKKDPKDRRDHTPAVRLTGAEYRLLQAAATAKGLTLSEWMRTTLLRAARRTRR